MKKTTTALVFFFIVKFSVAQLSAGVAFGTFNVPAASYLFKGYGPTLRIEYTGGEETQQVYLDLSLYKKNQDGFSTDIYDGDGVFVGSAATAKAYTIRHIQLGFKRSLAGNFTDTKLNCFLGAGGVASFVQTNNKYSFQGDAVQNYKVNRVLYGFHFNTGGQWRIKKILVVELRGNFDLVLKPITTDGGNNVSNILTSLRLGVVVPIVKY
jgi:hypothetical protein